MLNRYEISQYYNNLNFGEIGLFSPYFVKDYAKALIFNCFIILFNTCNFFTCIRPKLFILEPFFLKIILSSSLVVQVLRISVINDI